MGFIGRVVSVNVSLEKGTVKVPVEGIVVDSRGVVGDAHAGNWHRQVSLLAKEDVDRFSSEMGRSIGFGEFAENITVEGIDLGKACVLDRIQIG
ncbi:MAG: molybdenum cofactor synthesis protein, partial [Planctomycetes bacterium]|nr:molybdenum cofactor synthesis protein [Planctomycetota bacterium]